MQLLKNVLLDQHLTYLNDDKYFEYLKDYDKIFSVGIDIKTTSFDENCANVCVDRNCDFLTTDKKSYDHFFKIKSIKSVEIFQFMKKEPKIDRPVYCIRIKFRTSKTKTITKEQMNSLQTKVSGNVSRMLQFLYQVIGEPNAKRNTVTNEHVYECYVIFSHVVEEYGKLLYLRSLKPDVTGKYVIKYERKFRSHITKFTLALATLPESIKVVYEGAFDNAIFDSKIFDTSTETTWENRLNIVNTDIDDNGDPTNIEFNVDVDKLRQCIFDFRNFLSNQ